jgi:hypothetical protein
MSPRHCEEQSDEAIQLSCRDEGKLDCFASLAMTVWSDHAFTANTVTSGHNAFQRAAFR